MQTYKADLHIHSVLSPCGGLEMSPAALINRVKDLNIEWISITDHNSLANCPAYAEIAEKNGVYFTFGVEIQTEEEIHLLAYFDDRDRAMEFDNELYRALLPLVNDPEFFGDQLVIDARENIVRIEERALSNSLIWNLDTAVAMIKSYGGVFVPAHVDAEANSIIGQLGFLPIDLEFPLLGITADLDIDEFKVRHPELACYSFLRSSDAHYLNDMGKGFSMLTVEKPGAIEMILAAQKVSERKIEIK